MVKTYPPQSTGKGGCLINAIEELPPALHGPPADHHKPKHQAGSRVLCARKLIEMIDSDKANFAKQYWGGQGNRGSWVHS